ncbi:MAG: T9SS type A sorting domain-containing protein [Ignavibacteriae bacterium]|nr:T9SS C-terminal target domain-containing protein [Ignavibacteriota bacterium]NOG99511.1 T9SS type A sorting domain-containing protein [Ignavibacteriota bacterium]
MKKSFIIIITMLFLSMSNIFPNTGIAYIENAQVIGTTLSWELHFERTDEWGGALQTFNSSSAAFNVNAGALNSPSVVVEAGGPLDNANYNVTVILAQGKCIVSIDYAFNTFPTVILPLNVKTKLLTVSMNVTDAGQTADLSWDNVDTGFFDLVDDDVNTTLNGSFNGSLPVELNSFAAEISKNSVILNWETATELNNYGFDIERKASNGDWANIGFVEGAGNSNSPKSYYFTDNKLIGSSKFIYRLKQIDIDGKFEYSNEIEIEIVPTEFAVYQNYPNPFNPSTKIRFQIPNESKVTIKLYDMLGAEVITLLDEKKEPGVFEVNFKAENLPSGTYIYRVVADGFVEAKKMILLK